MNSMAAVVSPTIQTVNAGTSASKVLEPLAYAPGTPMGACGTLWDFRRRADRREALEMVDKLKPNFVIGFPPCNAFCQWNQYVNDPEMRMEDAERLMAE